MNEAMVGTADRNKEKLYENEELQAELRQRVGDDPSALAFEAHGLNLTTTHLGPSFARSSSQLLVDVRMPSMSLMTRP